MKCVGILALAKRCIRFSPQQVHLHWYGAARKIPRIFHTTQTPMPHFTPYFNDPRSRGWGGREYVHDFGRSSGYHRRFFFAWLGSSALFALPVAQMPLNVLAAVLLLWLISVFCMLHDVCTKRRVGRKPYPPAVICDPQGLTLYNTGRSITQQWRWQALDSVSVRDGGLHISPRVAPSLTYHDYRFAEDSDIYSEIAAVATDCQRGRFVAAPSVPPVHVDHTWYEQQPSLLWTSSSNLLLPLLALAVCWPDIGLRFDILENTIVLAVFTGFVALFSLLNHYRNHYLHRGTCRQVTLNNRGLHVLETDSGTTIGDSFSLPWADIRSITVGREVNEEKPGHSLHITDRLGNRYKIDIHYLQDADDSGREIAAAVDAVIHNQPLPPLTPGNAPVPRAAVTPTIRRFFWANVLFTAAVILDYGSCLYLHRCIVLISAETRFTLTVAYLALAAAAFFIEFDYRRRTRL